MNELEAYVMVGAPGAGKSTYVGELVARNPGAVVVCGDDIRAELYGDADIQGNYTEIHDRMLEIIEANVGKVIVLDGTHYRASYRKEAIAMLNSYGYTKVNAVVVDKPLRVCLEQNASRERNVPQHVIEKMHNALQANLKGIYDEGFYRVDFRF